jgi:ankyrin repeat protein
MQSCKKFPIFVVDYVSYTHLANIIEIRIDTDVSKNGRSLLCNRVSNCGLDDVTMLELLLLLGVEPNKQLTCNSSKDFQPLHICSSHGRSKSMNVLLECEANVNAVSEWNSWTHLQLAEFYEKESTTGQMVSGASLF